jgi:type IV pilus assembly protein PilP
VIGKKSVAKLGLLLLLCGSFLALCGVVDIHISSAIAQDTPQKSPSKTPAAPAGKPPEKLADKPVEKQMEKAPPSQDASSAQTGEPEDTHIDPGLVNGPEVEMPKRDLGILEGIIEDYDYKGQDKRDPFAPFMVVKPSQPSGPMVGPVTQLERFDLDQLRVVGIMWNVAKPKALIIDPENKTYVVYSKTRIGRKNGYIAEIREGELVIVESFNNEGRVSYQPRVIKLQRE